MEGHSVLVIAGDWRIRRLIRANLEPLGLDIRQAVNGQQGLDLLQSELPDLLLVDLDQLEADAGEWLSSLRVTVGEIGPPLVIMSTETLARRFVAEHCKDGFVQKPFAAKVLLQRVQQALAMPSPQAPPSSAVTTRS